MENINSAFGGANTASNLSEKQAVWLSYPSEIGNRQIQQTESKNSVEVGRQVFNLNLTLQAFLNGGVR